MSALRDYVSGSSSMQQSAESTVQLFITHNHLKARFPEIRLDRHVSSLLNLAWVHADMRVIIAPVEPTHNYCWLCCR